MVATGSGNVIGKYGPLVGAVDQGTSSTRFLVFASKTAELITYHQQEITQIYPEAGWVEQDPLEILNSVCTCIEKTVENLQGLEIHPGDIKAIGISNQRETTIVWDKTTGKPLYNAIVWLDNRTSSIVESLKENKSVHCKEILKYKSGLPLSTYFSSLKLNWLLTNVPEVKSAINEGTCLFGTVDSWLIWNLTGGPKGGCHVTDVTNASRTMLMDIRKLAWDQWLCSFFSVPMSILPKIHSSSEIYGYLSFGSLKGTPISGCLGDQSAALVGQCCLSEGMAKNTYGTGCFLLYNTGKLPIWSDSLLTTIAYKLGPNQPTYYALEGSAAIAGAAIFWLKDNLNLIKSSSETESLARSVKSSHGVYFVPAFAGLYAPYWQPDARGIICGLTQFATKAHIVRAALEAVCFQTKEILDIIKQDVGGFSLDSLQVDGGMSVNNALMQIQADILGIPIVRPSMPETTALGAAMAAGSAYGIELWNLSAADYATVTTDQFFPAISENEREHIFCKWKKAVRRSMHWETSTPENFTNHCNSYNIFKVIPGGIFLISSIGILLIAQHYSAQIPSI